MKRLVKKARLPVLSDYYNVWEYEFVNIGIQEVNVKDIIGLSNSRVDEYDDDWFPKNKDDSRWIYQKELIENNEQMEPIPLIKTPDNKYFPNGDGNHRISVAKVFNLNTVLANVTVMVPDNLNIESQWEDYSKDDRDKLNELSEKYKSLSKECNDLANEAFESDDYTKYESKLEELEILGDKISELDWKLIEEEKKFKNDLLNEYL